MGQHRCGSTHNCCMAVHGCDHTGRTKLAAPWGSTPQPTTSQHSAGEDTAGNQKPLARRRSCSAPAMMWSVQPAVLSCSSLGMVGARAAGTTWWSSASCVQRQALRPYTCDPVWSLCGPSTVHDVAGPTTVQKSARALSPLHRTHSTAQRACWKDGREGRRRFAEGHKTGKGMPGRVRSVC